MTFSEASEIVTPPEVKEEKTKEIGEANVESRESTETAKLVDNAHNQPEALIELAGSIEQAEAIESAVVKTVEAQVAIVEQAVQAAGAKQEQSGGDAAVDTVPLTEKPESAEDGGKVAIDTVPLPETLAEEVSQSNAEGDGDVAIDTVPLPEHPVKMESAEANIDAYDDPNATEKVDSAASISSNDSPSGISASEIIETEAESITSTTLEEPADNTLRGAGSQKNTGKFDDKSVDLDIGKEAFVNPNEFIAAVESVRDLPGMDPGGINDRGLDLGSITGGPSDITPDSLRNDAFPDLAFGKSEDDVLNTDRSIGDPRLSTAPGRGLHGPAGPKLEEFEHTLNLAKLGVDGADDAGADAAADAAAEEADLYGDTNYAKTMKQAAKQMGGELSPEEAAIADAAATEVANNAAAADDDAAADATPNSAPDPPPDGHLAPNTTPDPESGWSPGPVGSNAEFEIRATNPFEPTGGRGGIMRPEDDGTVFDEERTIPVSLEQALEQRLDPWINWGDDSQGITGPVNEEPPKHVQPRGVLGDPDEEMGVGDPDEEVGGGTIPI